jgi:hypothetical protein
VRKNAAFLRAGWLVAVAAAGLALGVGGCGAGGSSGSDKPGNHSSIKARKTAPKNADHDLAEMVAAVSPAKSGPPVEMKFSLPARPEVGQVLEVQVAVIPRAPVPESLSVSFQVGDGLDIVEGSQIERVEKLVDGVPIRHLVKVLPKRDGIFVLTALVSFVETGQDWTRAFSIPVIAGEGLPEQVAKGP